MNNFDKAFELVMKSEGGYTGPNGLKGDPGGETNLGVTKAAWSTWLKRTIQPGEMAKLQYSDVKPFYEALYWNKAYCPQLPTGVDYMAFDAAVNMGVGQAIRLLQRAIGCVADGVIGPNTMAAINNANPADLVEKYSASKEAFYRSLGTFQTFGRGWLNRVQQVKQNAKAML